MTRNSEPVEPLAFAVSPAFVDVLVERVAERLSGPVREPWVGFARAATPRESRSADAGSPGRGCGTLSAWESPFMTVDRYIDVADLRVAIDRVLAAVEMRLGTRIAPEADHYRTLDLTIAYDPRANQSDGLTVGQLSDDVKEIGELVDRDERDVRVWHDLAHIIVLLNRIGPEGRRAPAGSPAGAPGPVHHAARLPPHGAGRTSLATT